jgi:hypothetical protein
LALGELQATANPAQTVLETHGKAARVQSPTGRGHSERETDQRVIRERTERDPAPFDRRLHEPGWNRIPVGRAEAAGEKDRPVDELGALGRSELDSGHAVPPVNGVALA